MLKRYLFNAIGDIKHPERKLNVLMPVMVVLCLAGVAYFLYNQLINNKNDQYHDCRLENIELKKTIVFKDARYDSLKDKTDNDKLIIYKNLEYYLSTQEHNKKVLRGK